MLKFDFFCFVVVYFHLFVVKISSLKRILREKSEIIATNVRRAIAALAFIIVLGNETHPLIVWILERLRK